MTHRKKPKGTCMTLKKKTQAWLEKIKMCLRGLNEKLHTRGTHSFRELRAWTRAFGERWTDTWRHCKGYLGPDAEMRVGHELGSLLLSVVRLQEDIQHAHSHPGERHKVGEGLPHASCGGGTTAQAGQGAARVSPPSPKSSSQGQSPAAVLFSRLEARPATPVPVPEPSSPWAPLDIDRLSCSRELPSRPETRDPAAAAIFNVGSPAAPEAEIECWLWRGGGGWGTTISKGSSYWAVPFQRRLRIVAWKLGAAGARGSMRSALLCALSGS